MGIFKWMALSVTAGALIYIAKGFQSEPVIDPVGVCCEDLQVPRSGPSGRAGDKVGPMSATVVPNAEGGPGSIEVDGNVGPATILVKSWLSGSTFSKKCAGKRLVFKFSFVVEGPPLDYPFSWITFQSPNYFIIHSRERSPRLFQNPGQKGPA